VSGGACLSKDGVCEKLKRDGREEKQGVTQEKKERI